MRAIPDDNLAYPVLVDVGGVSTGSGFLLSCEGTQFLISAKHVFCDEIGNLKSTKATTVSQPRDPNESSSIVRSLDLGVLESNGAVLDESSKDVIAIRLGTLKPHNDAFTLDHEEGVHIAGTVKSGQVQVLRESTKPVKDVLIGNDAVLFGYPVSIGIKDSPQIDYEKPLLRKGIIAGKHEANGTLIIDCFVYPGNSGGPVLEIDIMPNGFKYSVIGVVSQFVPVTETWKNLNYGYENTSVSNSGYCVAVGMDPIWELTGAKGSA